jgi:CO/xanthine dehydrogenase FAD-binding subunit
VEIGAAVTLEQLQQSGLCPAALAVVIPEFASPAVRSFATVGGNICNASPAGDLLPPLYAHDAAVEIVSLTGGRTVPIEEFITGPGQTNRTAGELLSRVHLPESTADYRFYRKVAARRSNALSKLSVYVAAQFAEDRLSSLAIALGAVGPTVVRLRDVEAGLIGLGPEELLRSAPAALDAYAAAIRPIDDQRSSAEYRKATALTLLRFVLMQDLPGRLRESVKRPYPGSDVSRHNSTTNSDTTEEL